jgi:ribonuclease P protein component
MAAAGAQPHIRPWRLQTLKCRSDFQTVRKGSRCATGVFVLEGRQRPAGAGAQPRFGFTVARAVGGAVERNRIRRRLKAAVVSVQMRHARADFDYVLLARRLALEASFDELVCELTKALARVHRPERVRRHRDKGAPHSHA